MEFITTGNRIAVENFSIGKVYTIVWATGNYKSLVCVGKGSDFVMFQDQAPDLLFCLTMDTAIAVESIDEGGGGSGTSNYNELDNKPQVNGVTLVGNKSSADLNIYDVPAVTSENNNYILTASFSGGVGSYSWQPAQGGGGTSDYTQLSNLPQINSVELIGNKSLSDLGIASAEALADKQDVISDLSTIRSGAAAGATAVQPATLDSYQPLINDLSTIRSGAAAGATAVQPATLDSYQPLINDLSTIRSGAAAGATAVQPGTLAGYQTLIDSSHKLSSDLVDDTGHTNKFATAAQLAQIETNKNNILKDETTIARLVDSGAKNILDITATSQTINGVTFTVNNDGTITANGTATARTTLQLNRTVIQPGNYVLSNNVTTSSSTYWFEQYVYYSSTSHPYYQTYANGTYVSFTISQVPEYTITYLIIASGQTLSNLVFKPMICTANDYAISTDFAPYAMSNAELTAAIQALQAQLANQ